MKIVFEHSRVLPVKKYGGIERMLFWHMKELARQGHEPVLIGHPESQVEEFGITFIPRTREDWWELIPSDADGLQLFYNEQPPVDLPVINTIGGNGQIGEKFQRNTVFVSRKHAKLHNSNSFVYNALDLDEYPFTPPSHGWDHFLFLAKANWSVKNLQHARAACRQQHKHLHICGGRSFIPSRFIHSYGMVGGAEKLEIMQKCHALIFPIRWHEPFGLAVVEAMALGLPAITSPYGSMQELITPETGIICEDKGQLAQALVTRPNFDPQKIRNYVENRFSIKDFTVSYVKLFEKLINQGGYLNDEEPTWSLDQAPLTLLPF